MNKFLRERFALFGKPIGEHNDKLTLKMRKVIANPIAHYVLFGILMMAVGFMALNKIIFPRAFNSGLAITLAYSISSIGFCLLMGYSGLASLGTGGFIGIGTYSIYYVMEIAGLPYGVAILAAIAIAVGIGVIVGFISLRIEGIYLVILTLGLSEILRQLYVVLKDTIKVSSFTIFGQPINRVQSGIYIVSVLIVIVMIITHNLIKSPTGRAMLAMKNSTAAAQAMGISLIKYRLLAFVLCTVYASLTGVMLMSINLSSYMASPGTSPYALITSLNILAAVIIGGYKSIWGAVFGTYIMYGLQSTILNNVQFLAQNPVIITLISGVLVIIVVMFYPGGVAQLLTELKFKIKKLAKKLKEDKYGKDLG